jgi:hypothetical protein
MTFSFSHAERGARARSEGKLITKSFFTIVSSTTMSAFGRLALIRRLNLNRALVNLGSFLFACIPYHSEHKRRISTCRSFSSSSRSLAARCSSSRPANGSSSGNAAVLD